MSLLFRLLSSPCKYSHQFSREFPILKKILSSYSDIWNYYDIVPKFFPSLSNWPLGRSNLVRLNIKLLNSDSILIRRSSSIDRSVLQYVFWDQYHLPPAPLSEDAIILDLGANIGLTTLHFMNLYPKSKIIAVEMDRSNYELARMNVQYKPNIHLFNKAIWSHSNGIEYRIDCDPDAYRARELNSNALGLGKTYSVQSTTLNKLIEDNQLTVIDYLKMDIEGTEFEIFRQSEPSSLAWLAVVKSIKIELHETSGCSLENLASLIETVLKKNHFTVWKDEKHWATLCAIRS